MISVVPLIAEDRRAGRPQLITATVAAAAIALSSCSSGDVGAEPAATVSTAAAVSTSAAPTTTLPAPVCVAKAQAGDSLTAIANRSGITLEQLVQENLFDPTDTFHPGTEFDVCVGDNVDPTDPTLVEPPSEAVMRQQQELNELFSTTSMLPLGADGDSGRLTRQAICAARMGLGLPVHNRHLAPGSDE